MFASFCSVYAYSQQFDGRTAAANGDGEFEAGEQTSQREATR